MADRSALRELAREVARLAWPAVVQGLFHTVVLFTDRLMLGRYSAETLASMQVSGPLLWSVFSITGAFGAGVVAVVGRAVGAGDVARVRRTVVAASGFAAVVGCLIAVGGLLGAETLARLLAGAGPENATVRALAREYMGVVFLVAPLQVLGVAAMTSMQAGGDTRTPMRVTMLSGVVNLVVSYVLLFGAFGAPELGIRGAAIGTACAFSVHAVVLLAVLLRGQGPVALRRPDGPLWPAFRPVLRVSGPAFGEKLIFHAGFLTFAAIIGRLGETAMAANQSLIAIESLGFIAADGFGIAAGALVAQKLGAGQPDEAARVGWVSAGLGTGCLLLVSLLFLLIPETLVGLFSTDPEVVALGARCLRVAALAQPLMALTDSLAGALRGAGDTRSPMAVALVGPVIVRLAACWILAVELDLGLLGIWLGTTIDWAVRSLALAVFWARGRWRSIVVE